MKTFVRSLALAAVVLTSGSAIAAYDFIYQGYCSTLNCQWHATPISDSIGS